VALALAFLQLCGCETVRKPVAQLGGSADQVSNTVAAVEQPAVEAVKSASWALTEVASASEKVGGAAAELSNQTAAVGLELRRTLVDAQGAIAQIRDTAATLTNVTRAVAERVQVSTDHSKARDEALSELWNTLKPYVVAAAIALLLAVKRYGFGDNTVPDDVKKILRRK
jgi:ABC-type transporter Mla subunit MlaD